MGKCKLILAAMLASASILSALHSANAGGIYTWQIGGYQNQHGHHNNGGHQYTPKPFRICFYSRTNYRGHHYCESRYRNKNKVSHNWRHKIKSIKIYRNGTYGRDTPSIRLCNDFRGRGYCKTYYKGTARLSHALYGHVYSYNISQ